MPRFKLPYSNLPAASRTGAVNQHQSQAGQDAAADEDRTVSHPLSNTSCHEPTYHQADCRSVGIHRCGSAG